MPLPQTRHRRLIRAQIGLLGFEKFVTVVPGCAATVRAQID
jgi:hypothetical protein